MVFSSIPVYLDPPNWQQQSNPQAAGGGGGSEAPQLPPLVPPPPLTGGGGTASIRPGSMADRAWLGKLPPPDQASMKCPRCESTNTKFCYFNNYSLSQPRHFCKTCRRYWTRGGALRNVPVGGGFRRNKKSKRRSRSKSPVTSACPNSSTTTDIITHLPLPPPQLPFLPSLHNLNDFGGTGGDIGFNFVGIQPPVVATCGGSGSADMEFQMGGAPRFADQWRLQQFPFLSSLEQPPHGAYQFEGISEGVEQFNYIDEATGQLGSKPLDSQMATVKVEQTQGVNLSRNFLGIQGSDHQYWGGNAWTDLSGSITEKKQVKDFKVSIKIHLILQVPRSGIQKLHVPKQRIDMDELVSS